jgi:hypothetical protein
VQHEGNLTVLTFEPIGNEDDQFLQVVVTVENNEAGPFTGEATYFWRLNPAPVGALTSTPADKFAHCPASPESAEAPRPDGLWRLAYVRAGNLWLWDEGQEPLAVTDTGDVQQVKLSTDGETILPELYLGTLKGATTRLLQLESRRSYDLVVVPLER